MDYAPSTACTLSSSMHESYAVENMHLQVYLNLLACVCHTMSTHATEEKNQKHAHWCKVQALW